MAGLGSAFALMRFGGLISAEARGASVGGPAIHAFVSTGYKDVDDRDKPRARRIAMLGFTTKGPDRAAAVARLRHWTHPRFALGDDETVMVSELACRVPGCPPIETHVAFWTAAGRHHFKIFKPLAQVSEDDLPPAFMKNALITLEGFDCDCC